MNLEPLRRRAVRVPGNRGEPPSTAAKDASYLAPLGDLESGHCRLEQDAMGRRDGRRSSSGRSERAGSEGRERAAAGRSGGEREMERRTFFQTKLDKIDAS